MKKIYCFWLLLTVLFLFFPIRVCAWETSAEEKIADEAKITEYEYDDELFTEGELNGDVQISVMSKVSFIVTESFSGVASGIACTLGILLAVVIISAILKNIGNLSENTALTTAYGYFSVLVLSTAAFSVAKNVFQSACSALEGLNIYFSALLPSMITLYVFGGNPAVASASNVTLTMFIESVQLVMKSVLTPLLEVSFVMSLLSALPGGVDMSSVLSLIKNTVSMILGFIFSLFGFVLYFQTAIAAAADNAAFRSIKFISGSFIPIIGNVIGESARTVFASVSAVKAATGTIGILTILSFLIPPLIYTVLYKLSFLVSAIAAKMMGLEPESKFLYELNSVFNILTAILFGTSVLFVISIGVFIKSGVQ